ncbi:MAG: adenosine kinase [Lentisphaeria bacterium]
MAPKLIGIGSALVDQLAYVDEEFVSNIHGAKGGMELLDNPAMVELLGALPEDPHRVPGGSAANTVVGAARLGIKTGLLAKVGNDEAGSFYRRAAVEAGVDDQAFKVSEDIATGSCISLVTPDSERTMRTYLGAAATLAPENITVHDFEGFSHVHLEGYLLFNETLIMHVLECAKAAKCKVSLDLAAPEVVTANLDKLPRILEEYIDIVLANEEEAAAFAGTRDEMEALNELSELCEIAVVKLGKRGALIAHAGETYSVPAFPVEAVDTTGAGDLWAAGFLAGLLKGRPLNVCGEWGAKVAAEVIKVTGAAVPEEAYLRLLDEMGEINPEQENAGS